MLRARFGGRRAAEVEVAKLRGEVKSRILLLLLEEKSLSWKYRLRCVR